MRALPIARARYRDLATFRRPASRASRRPPCAPFLPLFFWWTMMVSAWPATLLGLAGSDLPAWVMTGTSTAPEVWAGSGLGTRCPTGPWVGRYLMEDSATSLPRTTYPLLPGSCQRRGTWERWLYPLHPLATTPHIPLPPPPTTLQLPVNLLPARCDWCGRNTRYTLPRITCRAASNHHAA